MTTKETVQVLAICQVAYPNSFNGMKKADIEALVNLWEIQFKDYEYQDVQMALNNIISNEDNPFLPTIARIKKEIDSSKGYLDNSAPATVMIDTLENQHSAYDDMSLQELEKLVIEEFYT